MMDKPGTFKIECDQLNGQGPDSYGRLCYFTDAEADAYYKKLVSLIVIFRKTPVLAEPKGFDGIGWINTGSCNTKYGYGLPSMVYFLFQTWSLQKGLEVKHTIEPPQWRFVVNQIDKFCGTGFNVTKYNDYQPTNPAYTVEKMDTVTIALRELFYLPGVKVKVGPGIDCYGDQIVIFNPERPPYWEQITIHEVFRLLFDYWRLVPDKAAMETMLKILNNEYSKLSEAERNRYAYFGNPESIFRIGSTTNETPIMRPNPAYWNKSLPRSAIQMMVLEIPTKDEVIRKMDDQLRRQDGYYYVSRLLYELDIQTLAAAIEK
jgi:hypothetical protein